MVPEAGLHDHAAALLGAVYAGREAQRAVRVPPSPEASAFHVSLLPLLSLLPHWCATPAPKTATSRPGATSPAQHTSQSSAGASGGIPARQAASATASASVWTLTAPSPRPTAGTRPPPTRPPAPRSATAGAR